MNKTRQPCQSLLSKPKCAIIAPRYWVNSFYLLRTADLRRPQSVGYRREMKGAKEWPLDALAEECASVFGFALLKFAAEYFQVR